MSEILIKELKKGKKMSSGSCKRGNELLQELRSYFNANGQGIPIEVLDADSSELFQKLMKLEKPGK